MIDAGVDRQARQRIVQRARSRDGRASGCRRARRPARTMSSSRSLRAASAAATTSRRSADDSPSMNRLSRSDSSSMTCSSSRRPSLDSSDCRRPVAGADQRRHRRFDRRERRPQVVRQRVEQRGLELLVAARRFRLARAIERRLQLLVEALDLVPPLLRFRGATLGARGQLAGDDGGHHEGDERDPVVGLLDPETDRRQEVVREGPRPTARPPAARARCPRTAR